MQLLNYESCPADPDLWITKAVHSNGTDYYEYVLLYVDDVLAVSENARENILEKDKYFTMKPESIGEPKIYLGGKISKVQLPNGVIARALSMRKYVKEAVKKVEKEISKWDLALMKYVKLPFTTNYSP